MADKINKLEYEPGNSVGSSDKPMICPSGHPIRQMRGGSHFACTVCDWSSRSAVVGSKPLTSEVVTQSKTQSHQSPQQAGVTVMSQHGIEQRERPNIVGR